MKCPNVKSNIENIFFSVESKNCQGINRLIIKMYNFSLELRIQFLTLFTKKTETKL